MQPCRARHDGVKAVVAGDPTVVDGWYNYAPGYAGSLNATADTDSWLQS